MKKSITALLAVTLSLTGISCSVQEDDISQVSPTADSVNSPELSENFGAGVVAGLNDLKMDFVTLFRYANEEELKLESERIYRLMLKEMPSDILDVKGARYMAFTADVKEGRAALTGVYYLNKTKDIALQQSTPNGSNGYIITHNVPAPALDYKLIKEDVQLNDAQLLSTYLIDKAGKVGSFMIISSGDRASLYFKS